MKKRHLLSGFFLLIFHISYSQDITDVKQKIKNYFPSQNQYIIIDISEQLLYLFENDTCIISFPISSSKYGIGNQSGSNKTPLGLHCIARKIGSKVPYGGILKGRKFTGKIAEIYTDETDSQKDVITTRILWLKGLESGVNKGYKIDSYNRYIYIHGTNEEGLIGKPLSHGCIRMKNSDVIKLFNMVSINTPVYISE
ncbi:MAG: L,D-transpeptidase [Bacteroidales bacterium]|nr:L,D-transpeptidase [Bacteroidales bacterium]